MDGIKEAWDIVFGEGVFDALVKKLMTILGIAGVALAIVIAISVWRAVAKSKIRKAMLIISEYPDKEHCERFLQMIKGISGFGKALAKIGTGYSGLSKGECRTIFNTTVAGSQRLDGSEKNEIRRAMISVGCTGLLSIE